MGDLLVAESRLYRNYGDYSLYRKFVKDPVKQQGPYIVLISAETHAWFHVDNSLESYLGYSLDELENDWIVAYHPDSYEETDEQLTEILCAMHSGEVDYRDIDVRYQAKAGYSIWAQLTYSLVKDWKGVPEYFMMVIRDKTLVRWTELLYAELEALVLFAEQAGIYSEDIWALEGLLRHYDGESIDGYVMQKVRALVAS